MTVAQQKNKDGAVQVSRLSDAIGAFVECGDVRTLSPPRFSLVHQAFLDNLVLVIRGQKLTDDDLMAFGRRFGELTRPSAVHISQAARDEKYPEIAVISNVIEGGMAIGGLGDGELGCGDGDIIAPHREFLGTWWARRR